MISFSRYSEYVEWLHVIENVELWAAKERAQKLYFKRTGQKFPLDRFLSTSELAELRRAKLASTAKKIKRIA